jgi:hypothetical protein
VLDEKGNTPLPALQKKKTKEKLLKEKQRRPRGVRACRPSQHAFAHTSMSAARRQMAAMTCLLEARTTQV